MSNDLLRRLDETPVSASLAVLYVGLALLTDPFDPTGQGYDQSLYNGYGRVVYFRLLQNF